MTGHAFNLVLDSHPKNIAEVEPFVFSIVRTFDIREELYGNMLITLTEAVSNAILHGNGALPSKKVHISTKYVASKICFTIEDEGQGFNPEVLPDPTAPENLLNIGGRGVFLMRQLSDQVRFLENGKVVELEFNI